ncbi:zinc knuckle protein [Trichinella spiralis]|uniref:zinc knuckle protein n=1 Tax=Trichinella spiralis TaxID=6334 RepID=UPI0001EFE203|nr:zinc knuckle protein [Trichinella spiralis]
MPREKGVCYKCLKTGHRARECRNGRPCGVDGCRRPHHQLLHPPAARESARSPGPDRPHQGLLVARTTPSGGLQTIRARAYGPDGNQVVVNCLFDTGAQVSFIRKDVAEVPGLTGPHERCRFTTLGGRVGPEHRWRRVEFRLGAVGTSGRPETSTLMMALAIPRVCGKVQPVQGERYDGAPAGTKPEMGQRRETPLMIDVLISIDYYYEFVTGRMRRRATGGPVALETLLGWVVCGRTSPRRTAEVESFPTNPENSADVLLRKNGEINEVEILPEEDLPEGNKEALEKRKETSTSVKRSVRSASRYAQVNEASLTLSNGPDRSVRCRSARSEHGDAEPAEGELNRIEVTRKQLMGKENPDTPVSMSHPAVSPGRHEWTEALICHRHWGTLPTEAYHTPAAIEQRVWIPAERMRRQDPCCGQPKRRRRRWPGCRCATTSLVTRGPPRWEQDWCCHQRLMATWWRRRGTKRHHGTLPPGWKRRSEEVGPSTNAPTWNRKENRRRVHRKPGAVAEPATECEVEDGLRISPPGKPANVRSAPEIASTPAASELPIGGSRESTAGPLTLALYIGPGSREKEDGYRETPKSDEIAMVRVIIEFSCRCLFLLHILLSVRCCRWSAFL